MPIVLRLGVELAGRAESCTESLRKLHPLVGPARFCRRVSTTLGRRGRRWCQTASTRSRRACALPVLVIEPWDLVVPEEDSVGTSPRSATIACLLSRVQSPISTAPERPTCRPRAGTPAGSPPGRTRSRRPSRRSRRRAVPVGRGWPARCRRRCRRPAPTRAGRTPAAGAGRAATGRGFRSRACRRSRRCPGPATAWTGGAGPPSDPRGRPRGPGPDPGRSPARGSGRPPPRSRPGAAAGPGARRRGGRS